MLKLKEQKQRCSEYVPEKSICCTTHSTSQVQTTSEKKRFSGNQTSVHHEGRNSSNMPIPPPMWVQPVLQPRPLPCRQCRLQLPFLVGRVGGPSPFLSASQAAPLLLVGHRPPRPRASREQLVRRKRERASPGYRRMGEAWAQEEEARGMDGGRKRGGRGRRAGGGGVGIWVQRG